LEISDLRKQQYEYHEKLYPYINDWMRHPYTWFKARFYMESSAILVYWCLRFGIRPNTVTMVYISCGIVGGVLLAIPMKITIYLSIFIFFSKGILDWSDGHLARITNRVSLKGGILDDYGAHVNSLGFWAGLGFYSANITDSIIFYYLIPILLFFYAADLYQYACLLIIQHANLQSKDFLSVDTSREYEVKRSPFRLIRATTYIFEHFCDYIRDRFPDDRARSVDFVCFLILLELNNDIFISWIVFLLFFLKKFILYTFSVYAIVHKNWVEHNVRTIWGKKSTDGVNE
jgi:hypothetical protein